MEATAIQKNIRMSPRKVRLVADVVRLITPAEALKMLPSIRKRAATPLYKAIKSAVANAHVKGMDVNNLTFKEIQIMEGPTLKRGIPVSRGRWHRILKRSSHIKIVVTAPASQKLKSKGVKKTK